MGWQLGSDKMIWSLFVKYSWGCLLNLNYRILSKNLSQTVARKKCHLVTIRIGMNKMAESDEYLDYRDALI